MGTRGRKSSAELSTIGVSGVAVTRRPDPPAHLGDEASEIWRSICNSLPGDWFTPGTQPLLEAFCSLTVSQHYTQRALQRIERAETEFDAHTWRDLVRQLGEVSGRIAQLATRMRLTPQSRYVARTAGAAAKRDVDGPKLWES